MVPQGFAELQWKTLGLHVLFILHILFWVYVLLVPVVGSIGMVKFLSLVVIPTLYVLYTTLPFHVLVRAKEHVAASPEEKEKFTTLYENSIFLRWYFVLIRLGDKHSFCNALSPQGMCMLSLMICCWRLA